MKTFRHLLKLTEKSKFYEEGYSTNINQDTFFYSYTPPRAKAY